MALATTAFHLAAILLVLPVAGRLSALRSNPRILSHTTSLAQNVSDPHPLLVSEEPMLSHPLTDIKKRLKDKLGSETVGSAKSGCPRSCSCHDGDPSNGGKALLSGMCLHFCSEEFDGWRHCGDAVEYRQGASIDCRQCKDPANYPGEYKVYEPAHGAPKMSLILLNPWNGTPGYMMNLTIDQTELEPTLRKSYRIVDAAHHVWPQTDYTQWYGYKNDDDWWNDKPIEEEVDMAVAYVHYLIEQEYKVVGDYKRIVLVGLSQGACLALEAAIRFPKSLGLVLSQRGIIQASVRRETKAVAGSSPYVLLMGTEDHTFGVDIAKKDCRFLEKNQAPVFMKAITGLDHNGREHEGEAIREGREHERKLTGEILAALASQQPTESAKALAKLTEWTACN